MPIGNLTSQIFANIYLNEFDRFVKHNLKAKQYVRYGDDFIIVENNLDKLNFLRAQAVDFLQNILKLKINLKSDKIFKTKNGLKFLGVVLWPTGRTLNKRSRKRVQERLNHSNAASYRGLVIQHGNFIQARNFSWIVSELLLY